MTDSRRDQTPLKHLKTNSREENRLILGRIVMSTEHRDLVWTCNGDDALITLRMFSSGRGYSPWNVSVDPLTSDAACDWLVWKPKRVVAMRWEVDAQATSDALMQAVGGGGPKAAVAVRLLKRILTQSPPADTHGAHEADRETGADDDAGQDHPSVDDADDDAGQADNGPAGEDDACDGDSV